MPRTVTVLALDGGGIRGIIPASILAEIERRTGSRIARLFDLIAGTSTGGILALGLAKPDGRGRPQFSAAELVSLYEREGRRIFDRSLWREVVALDNLLDERYDSAGLEQVLEQTFGSTRLSQATTEVLITAYELETRQAWFLARHKARDRDRKGWDFAMKDVARATSAAPTYFEPYEVRSMQPHGGLVDGGIFANNPAMCGWVEARKLYPDAEVLVVSLGTGQHTRPIHVAEARRWGLAGWAQPILACVFDGVADTVDHQMQTVCAAGVDGRPRYYRFQTELDSAMDDLDNATRTNILALKRKAADILREREADLAALCDRLRELRVKPQPVPRTVRPEDHVVDEDEYDLFHDLVPDPPDAREGDDSVHAGRARQR